jgi:hypothetical protein
MHLSLSFVTGGFDHLWACAPLLPYLPSAEEGLPGLQRDHWRSQRPSPSQHRQWRVRKSLCTATLFCFIGTLADMRVLGTAADKKIGQLAVSCLFRTSNPNRSCYHISCHFDYSSVTRSKRCHLGCSKPFICSFRAVGNVHVCGLSALSRLSI